jgi:penicillin-binding protein 1C
VKTGTSNDYRDAWAVGFSARFTVGVWMGNLDGREMQGVSGSIGPGWVLRAVFAELRRERDDGPPVLDRRLVKRPICAVSGAVPGAGCPVVEEWFEAGTWPADRCTVHASPETHADASVRTSSAPTYRLSRPTQGLQLAMDPRIPDALEAFNIEIEDARQVREIVWYVDHRRVGTTGAGQGSFAWPLRRGKHVAHARIWPVGSKASTTTPEIAFTVK